ncbi:MAG: ubiquinol-cytochrome c reductase iron-sulfur subunit, partial [Candidatus Baltobacteraceae bacterium]
DPGTPEEVTRRTFMANATTVMSGLIGLGLAIPILGSLAPPKNVAGGTWSPLDPAEFKQLQTAAARPIKLSFTLKTKDSYLPEEATAQYVWGIKTETANFEKARPDLFGKSGSAFPVINMGFVIFSPICPHLGCRFDWSAVSNKFLCPCHGSQYTLDGTHVAGPAPRGLDPLPLREQSGMAEITWIRYASSVPDRVVVSYQA